MQYLPLSSYLTHLEGAQWKASFAEIERLLGFDLPPEARADRVWWRNDWTDGELSPANAWLGAGFETADVDIYGHRLTFRRIGIELLDPPTPSQDGLSTELRLDLTSHEVTLVLAALAAGIAGFLTGKALKRG
jgi:hypothetical protein